jgi:hypothetical protein
VKLALVTFMTLILSGCQSTLAPAPGDYGWVWGVVVDDETGDCIVGATVQVVRGQRLGESVTQTESCGDSWEYDFVGFAFEDLAPGVEMTLRASASGYTPHEKTVIPSAGGPALVLTPSRIK